VVLPAGAIAPPSFAALNVGDSLSVAMAGLAQGRGLETFTTDDNTGATQSASAVGASPPPKRAKRDTHAKRSTPSPPQGAHTPAVPTEAVPQHNSAGEGLYPLRSGLADAGDANPRIGYYGGAA
jgi:hypothetical protein